MESFACIISITAMSNFLSLIQLLKQLPGFSLKSVSFYSLLLRELCIGRIQCSNLQVVSRQFTDRFFDQFTDRALGIRAEDDNLLLFLALDIDPSPHPTFGLSPCPIFIT